MIILNSFTCNENFSSVCSNLEEISAWFPRRDTGRRLNVHNTFNLRPMFTGLPWRGFFAYNRNCYCCRLAWEMKFHDHGLTTWNFNSGWNCPPYNPSLRWSFCRKYLAMFAKGSISDLCLGSECVHAVCVIIICQ